MPQKPTCYFSYSWDSDTLSFLLRLKQEIEKKSKNRITVILDRQNFDIGVDFKEKERQILKSDLVVAFLPPNIKGRLTYL